MKDKLKQSKLIKNILPIAILIASPTLLFSTIFAKHKESVLRNETITTQNIDVVQNDQNEKSKYKFVQTNSYTKGIVIHDKTDDLDHLYMWGYNNKGQLGLGNTDFQTTPTEVLFEGEPLGLEGEITSFSSNYDNSGVTIKNTNGKTNLYMWGSNDVANVGNGDSKKNTALTPQKIKISDGAIFNKPLDVIDFCVGEKTSALILTDSNNEKDHLFVWGENYMGLIPNTNKGANVLTPTKIASTGDDIGDNGKIKNLTKVVLGFQSQFIEPLNNF